MSPSSRGALVVKFESFRNKRGELVYPLQFISGDVKKKKSPRDKTVLSHNFCGVILHENEIFSVMAG